MAVVESTGPVDGRTDLGEVGSTLGEARTDVLRIRRSASIVPERREPGVNRRERVDVTIR